MKEYTEKQVVKERTITRCVYDNSMLAKLRQVQQIVSNVRWDYGPHTNIEIIPAGDPNTQEGE